MWSTAFISGFVYAMTGYVVHAIQTSLVQTAIDIMFEYSN